MDDVSRRSFLKILGAGVGSLAIFPKGLFEKKVHYYDEKSISDAEEYIPIQDGSHYDTYILKLVCEPDKRLRKIIRRNFKKGKTSCNMFVNFTFKKNYEVTYAKSNEIPDGIIECVAHDGQKYSIWVEVLGALDIKGNRWTPRRVKSLFYTGKIKLHDGICIYGSDKIYGTVIAIDYCGKGYADVLF